MDNVNHSKKIEISLPVEFMLDKKKILDFRRTFSDIGDKLIFDVDNRNAELPPQMALYILVWNPDLSFELDDMTSMNFNYIVYVGLSHNIRDEFLSGELSDLNENIAVHRDANNKNYKQHAKNFKKLICCCLFGERDVLEKMKGLINDLFCPYGNQIRINGSFGLTEKAF
ncbi:hypothetical protein [Aeromonas sp. 600276]|uniref:hypothetical protein n=1 Tax=Aeromonas sp. 600276 TaxID=2712026 RepID=UPI003BA23ADB